MATDFIAVVKTRGYVTLRNLPSCSSLEAFPEVGRLLQAGPVGAKSRYNSDEGLLHTDLANWFVPPQYLALFCVDGAVDIGIRLLDSNSVISALGEYRFGGALVQPHDPIDGRRSLIRLLDSDPGIGRLFRWDPGLLSAATSYSAEVLSSIAKHLAEANPDDIVRLRPGAALILDNWRMLHARATGVALDDYRRLERAYFGIHQQVEYTPATQETNDKPM